MSQCSVVPHYTDVLILNYANDDDEFRFNDASTHEGHLRQNGKLIWFCNETAIKISHICIKSTMQSKRAAIP